MIAIVGAGLGGLTLARILHVHGIETAVYDLDASPTARHQGGMLDMHEESGQMALRAAGLFTEFERLVLPGGDASRVLDKHGTVLLDQPGNGRRPEIDRGALRDLLLHALPEDTVRWGSRVTDVRATPGGHQLTFADGHTETTELLIGADGAWSRVRPLLTGDKPAYSGLSFVEIRVPRADVVGNGMLFALDDERGFLAHRESDGEYCIYVAAKKPADWATSGEVSRESLLALFPDWHPDLRALISQSVGPLIPRPIYALPVGRRWPRVPGVTLLGDAAHLMSPFAGEGANLAMQDAAELGAALAEHRDDIEAGLRAYERKLFPRSAEHAASAARKPTAEDMAAFFGAFPGDFRVHS